MARKKQPKPRTIKIVPRFRNHPAQYAILLGDEQLALLIRGGDGWRICRATATSKIGFAISPVGLDRFRDVKAWAIAYFGRQQQGGGA